MPLTTITEALGELKTIDKRIANKQEFVLGFLFRQNQLRDPLEKDGGSVQAVAAERQSIADLENRKVAIRRAIAKANDTTEVTVSGTTMTVAQWLTWRRDVAPSTKKFLDAMKGKLAQVRAQAQKSGVAVASSESAKDNDIIVNVSEKKLSEESEKLETILGVLDGQLSLKNATVTVEV